MKVARRACTIHKVEEVPLRALGGDDGARAEG
jgi:hypothetical protein